MLRLLTLHAPRAAATLRVWQGLVVSAEPPFGELAGLTLRDVERLARFHGWQLRPQGADANADSCDSERQAA